MATGRTVTRWIRFGVDDADGDPREIPINSIGFVGFTFGEEDVSAWQDAVIAFLAQQPTAAIEITGPFSDKAEVAWAASGLKPALTGSYTVLSLIAAPTFTTPLGLAVHFGMQGYWADGDPVFGVISPSATEGYVCTKFVVDGSFYQAKFQPYPGSTPAWGTDDIT